MLCREGRISLLCFLIGASTGVIPEILSRLEYNVYIEYFRNIWFLHLFPYGCLNFLVFFTFHGFLYQVAVRSLLLGHAFIIGLLMAATAPPCWQTFGTYLAVLAIFHFSEFFTISWTNPAAVSIDSFILNHSIAYGVAMCSSWIEFLVERHYFPEIKEPSSISYFGLILCISGEILRKTAILTAKHNFNHIVQSSKDKDHELVTHGVYRLCRHPSYVGWFYWSIGTQLILQNPFCLLAYTLTSWWFFSNRVFGEEITLLNFFGEAYIDYQRKVGTGLPFISGYKVDL